MTQSIRYVGLDVHKHYVMVGAVDQTQQTVLPPRKVALADLEGWAQKYLQPTDHVVLEATTNAWYVHDLLEPLVERVVVAHPPQVKLIAAAMVKTDKKDTMTLARLLAVNLVPAVWVPPLHVRDLRALLAHRRRLVSQQTQSTQSWRTAPGKTDFKVSCTVIILCHRQASCTTLPSAIGGSLWIWLPAINSGSARS
jgi:transposase